MKASEIDKRWRESLRVRWGRPGVVLLLAVAVSCGQEMPVGEGESLDVLMQASHVAAWGGRARAVTPEARAFMDILERKDGIIAFRQLASSESAVSAFYGLCGLRLLSMDEFRRAWPDCLRRHEGASVLLVDGDTGAGVSFNEVGRVIGDGRWPGALLVAGIGDLGYHVSK